MDAKVRIVQTKKAIVVSLFFIYLVYVIALTAKHTFMACKNEKLQKLSKGLSKLQFNMIDKCFFFYYLIVLCTQVNPTVFSAIIVYFYWGALGLNAIGCIIDKLRVFRMFGMIIMCLMVIFLFFTIVINDWCNMFYFGSEFSLEYKD